MESLLVKKRHFQKIGCAFVKTNDFQILTFFNNYILRYFYLLNLNNWLVSLTTTSQLAFFFIFILFNLLLTHQISNYFDLHTPLFDFYDLPKTYLEYCSMTVAQLLCPK